MVTNGRRRGFVALVAASGLVVPAGAATVVPAADATTALGPGTVRPAAVTLVDGVPRGAVESPRHLEDRVTVTGLSSSGSTVVVKRAKDNGSQWLLGRTGRMQAVDVRPDTDRVLAGPGTLYETYQVFDPTFAGTEHVVIHDLSTGTRSEVAMTRFVDRLIATSSAGWWAYDQDAIVLRKGTTVLGRIPMGACCVAPDAEASGRKVFSISLRDVGGVSTERALLEDPVAGTQEVVDTFSRSHRAIGLNGGTVAFDGTTLAWASDRTSGPTPGESIAISSRPAAGGPVTTVRVDGFLRDLTVFRGGIAYVDATSHLVVLPAGGGAPVVSALGGIVAAQGAGSVVRVAVGGAPDVAGVYSVKADGTALHDTTIAPARAVVSDIDLAAGRLLAADSSDSSVPHRKTVYLRDIEGTTTLRLGRETTLPVGARQKSRVTFSADRGIVREVVPGQTGPYRFTDGGAPGPLFSARGQQLSSLLSGPYAAVGRDVMLADGHRILPSLIDVKPFKEHPNGMVSLFGPLLVVADDRGLIRMEDLRTPQAPSVTLRATLCPGTGAAKCLSFVAAGGDTVAWVDIPMSRTTFRPDGPSTVNLRDLRTGTTRTFTRPQGPDVPFDAPLVRADVGVLAWTELVPGGGQQLMVLDTTSATSKPVLLATAPQIPDIAVDDGLVAWRTGTGDAFVARVPFDQPRRPRILGVLGMAFSPDGDGSGDVWRPQIDLTRELTSATLTVRRGSTVVRTLTGTAPNGSIRDITWDGKDSAGAALPDGVYTWALTGSSADGRPVAALDGVSPATGTVAIDRTGTTTSMTSAFTTRGNVLVPVARARWVSAPDAAGNTPWSYDVRVRDVLLSATGKISYSAPRRVASGLFDPTTLLTLTKADQGRVLQFSARTKDVAGNVGPWAPWTRSTAVSYDDTRFTAKGKWDRFGRDGISYLGTVSSSRQAGASLTKTAVGSRIMVFGDRCGVCGKFQVYVDGKLVTTVGTQSKNRDVHRSTFFDRTFPRGRHTVRIVVLATKGHPEVQIDGVAFLLP